MIIKIKDKQISIKHIFLSSLFIIFIIPLFIHTELSLDQIKGLAEPFRNMQQRDMLTTVPNRGPATAAAISQGAPRRVIDTYDTIFSPIYGMLAWHSPYLLNLWQNDSESATARLVQQLFNLQFDGVTFDVSGIPGNIISHLSCYDIGYIIGLIYNYEQATNIYQQQVTDNTRELAAEQDATSPRSGKDGKKSPRPISPFEQKQRDFAKYKNEELRKIKKELNDKLTEYLDTINPMLVKQNIITYYSSQIAHAGADIAREQDATKRQQLQRKKDELENKLAAERASQDIVLRAYHEGKKAFVNDIVGSMADTRYLPHNTILLLLVCMWKKVNNYDDIIHYTHGVYTAITNKEILFTDTINEALEPYTALNYEIFKSILTPIIAQSPYTAEDYQRIIHTPLSNPFINLAEYAFAFVGFDIFGDTTKLLPPEVQMSMNTNVGNTIFPDCGETSLLKFFAAILYNPTTKQWNIDLLNAIHANTALKNFFMTFDPNSLITQGAHDAWATVVSNKPQVNYIRPQKCEINVGADNMLKVIATLIPGVDTFEKLATIFTSNGAEISFDTTNMNDTKYGSITIQLKKNNQSRILIWHFYQGHFNLSFSQEILQQDPRPEILRRTEFKSTIATNIVLKALLTHYMPIPTDERITHYYQAFLYNIEKPEELLKIINNIAASENPYKKHLIRSLYHTLSHKNNIPIEDQKMYHNDFFENIKQYNINVKDILLEKDMGKGTDFQKFFYIKHVLLHEPITEVIIEKIMSIIATVQSEIFQIDIIAEILQKDPVSPQVHKLYRAIIPLLQTVQGDLEKSIIIGDILQKNPTVPIVHELYRAIIPIIPTVQDDGIKAIIIGDILQKNPTIPEVRELQESVRPLRM